MRLLGKCSKSEIGQAAVRKAADLIATGRPWLDRKRLSYRGRPAHQRLLPLGAGHCVEVPAGAGACCT